jgi:hypothetical protein
LDGVLGRPAQEKPEHEDADDNEHGGNEHPSGDQD